jgi:hypothetical protein
VNAIINELENKAARDEVGRIISEFLNDTANSSLTFTYGFGNLLYSIFPQDDAYVAMLENHNKNVILAYQPADGPVWRVDGSNSNLFKVNALTENSMKYKSRIKNIISKTFGLKTVAIEKSTNNFISFKFKTDSSEYLLIWVNSTCDPIYTILLNYKDLIYKFRTRNLIDSVSRDTGLGIGKTQFIRMNFTNTFGLFSDSQKGTEPNLFKLSNNPRKAVFSRNNGKKIYKGNNLWNNFTGGAITLKLKRNNRHTLRRKNARNF